MHHDSDTYALALAHALPDDSTDVLEKALGRRARAMDIAAIGLVVAIVATVASVATAVVCLGAGL